MTRTYSLIRWHGDGTPRETLAKDLSVSSALERWSLEIFNGTNPDHLYAEQIGPSGRKQFLGFRALQNYADQEATSGISDMMRGGGQPEPSADDRKLASYLTQENSVLHERVRKLEIALSQETEACAKVADDRAEICRQAMKGPPESLPGVEVHCLNEALHIAQLIRSRR